MGRFSAATCPTKPAVIFGLSLTELAKSEAVIQDRLARGARNGPIQTISAECAFQCQTPIAP
jgi:hypothetical protein